jgi:hypothetical protein
MTKHITNVNLNTRECQTQKHGILEWLLLGLPLTPLEALEHFGTMKCASRISELRDEDWPINDRWVTLENGKKVKEYFI